MRRIQRKITAALMVLAFTLLFAVSAFAEDPSAADPSAAAPGGIYSFPEGYGWGVTVGPQSSSRPSSVKRMRSTAIFLALSFGGMRFMYSGA